MDQTTKERKFNLFNQRYGFTADDDELDEITAAVLPLVEQSFDLYQYRDDMTVFNLAMNIAVFAYHEGHTAGVRAGYRKGRRDAGTEVNIIL